MEFLPGAPVLVQGGIAGMLIFIVTGFVWAVLTGKLEPRATSLRIEAALEKRYETLKEAYLISETARLNALDVAKESLETSKSALRILEELRAASKGN